MSNFNLHRINDGVFVAQDPIVKIGSDEIDFIKAQSAVNDRKRARICMHKNNEDSLHEMVIAISAKSYIHPHKHPTKSESFHVIEGEVDVVVFDDAGEVSGIFELGDPTTNKAFFYRLDQCLFHTLLLKTNYLVVHEVTNGPFLRENPLLAPWAPPEGDIVKTNRYMEHVLHITQLHKSIVV